VRQAMYRAVNQKGGTAFNSKLIEVNFEMAGKTGTSQIISKRVDEMTEEEIRENKSHAIFTAFFPFDLPKYAITVFIENGESGAKTAAPLAKEIIKKYQGW
jgi:penicillin-binding protein 2